MAYSKKININFIEGILIGMSIMCLICGMFIFTNQDSPASVNQNKLEENNIEKGSRENNNTNISSNTNLNANEFQKDDAEKVNEGNKNAESIENYDEIAKIKLYPFANIEGIEALHSGANIDIFVKEVSGSILYIMFGKKIENKVNNIVYLKLTDAELSILNLALDNSSKYGSSVCAKASNNENNSYNFNENLQNDENLDVNKEGENGAII